MVKPRGSNVDLDDNIIGHTPSEANYGGVVLCIKKNVKNIHRQNLSIYEKR